VEEAKGEARSSAQDKERWDDRVPDLGVALLAFPWCGAATNRVGLDPASSMTAEREGN